MYFAYGMDGNLWGPEGGLWQKRFESLEPCEYVTRKRDLADVKS